MYVTMWRAVIVQGDRFICFNERHPPLKTPVILRLQLLLGGVPGEGRRARGLEREDDLRDVQRLVRLVLQEYAHVSLVAHGAIGINLQHKAGYVQHMVSTRSTLREARCPPRKNSLLMIFSPTWFQAVYNIFRDRSDPP